jgi:hypothetical protein
MSEVREAKNVVTSENLAEFHAQKLGLAPEAPIEAVVDEETPTEPISAESENEPQAEEEVVTEERKPNPKLEKRFSKLTSEREMARQEAERERQRATDLERELQELKKQASPTQTFVDEEPQPHQFADAFEYAKALSEWSAENAIKQLKQREEEARIQAERQAQIDTWLKRQEAVKAELPDYEEMIESAEVMVSDQVKEAIMESDVGPRILYHLAENPEFAEQLAGYSTARALKEIGKLEARYEQKAEAPKAEPSKPVATKSKAPAPINPLKATSAATDTPIDSNGEFFGTAKQWREMRRAGKIR